MFHGGVGRRLTQRVERGRSRFTSETGPVGDKKIKSAQMKIKTLEMLGKIRLHRREKIWSKTKSKNRKGKQDLRMRRRKNTTGGHR